MDKPVYTDLTNKTFSKALARLKGKVPESLSDELKELNESGHIHDPTKIVKAIRRCIESEADGNQNT